MNDAFWTAGRRGETLRCKGCLLPRTSRPSADCTEGRHAAFHAKRRADNNALRRTARALARSRGEVKRYGTEEAKKAQTKRAYRKRRLAIIQRLGGVCDACGHADHRALQVHHKCGGGWIEREAKGWRYHLDMSAMNASALRTVYRLLCANCHQVEHYEAGEDTTAPAAGIPATGG